MPKKNIYQQIEEEEKALEALTVPEEGGDSQNVDDEPPPAENDQAADEGASSEERDEPPPAEDQKKAQDGSQPPGNDERPHTHAERAEFIRLRQEAAEAKRKAREYEQELARIREANAAKPAPQAMPPQKAPDPEPNKEVDYEAWVEWKLRQVESENQELRTQFQKREEQVVSREAEEHQRMVLNKAVQEITEYEDAFRQKAPDYDDAAGFLEGKIKDGIRLSNPWLSPAQVNQVYARQVLNMCGNFARAQLDPAEEIYKLAKANGYAQAAPSADDQPKSKVEIERGRLEAIRKNKAVKTGLVAGGKSGTNGVNRDGALKMSNAEFSRLSAAELRELNEM